MRLNEDLLLCEYYFIRWACLFDPPHSSTSPVVESTQTRDPYDTRTQLLRTVLAGRVATRKKNGFVGIQILVTKLKLLRPLLGALRLWFC